MHPSKRDQALGAAAVIVVPALLAIFLTRTEAPERPPKVTRVLAAAADGTRAPSMSGDSPVANATRGGRKLSIQFKRGSRAALGTMKIPAIGLRTQFYDGVVDEAVKRGPGHWPGTPWPGQRGNSVFAGHRTTYTHPFADLDLLQPEARIQVAMRNGETTTYRVFRTTIASEDRYASVVLKQPRNRRVRMITLFACTPKGSRSHRIIVQARAMAVRGHPKRRRGGDAMAPS